MATAQRLVRVALPHHFAEGRATSGSGHGSQLKGGRLARSLAFGRCLSGLLELEQQGVDAQLAIARGTIEHFQAPADERENGAIASWRLEIHICSDGSHQLDEVLELFAPRLHCHRITVDDPRELALAARDLLIRHPRPAELNLYLEDDLVIADRDYLAKQLWFQQLSGPRMVLQPHRYERVARQGVGALLVDGPLHPSLIEPFAAARTDALQGRFRGGAPLSFDLPSNPHAGCFCLSRAQLEQLRNTELPRQGFIGPLETAATLTLLPHFTVLKPALRNWRFLTVEHGHPGFVSRWDRWPHTRLQQPQRSGEAVFFQA
ncbi:MAG: hypothetical protein VKI83_09525 [Synechococcaceae cyanobacterium]|nr:hypothetical protein [Synechococcaceae cyanobacterium]